MSGDVMSGGVVIAIAAGLWIAYLLPAWMRRREYLATERTAVRLQQTLRILAATSELPEQVRLEANARAVAEQHRILRKAEAKALAQARADAAADARAERVAAAHAARVETTLNSRAERLVAQAASATSAAVIQRSHRGRGLRRARAATSLTLLISLVAVGLGIFSLLATESWVLLASGATIAVGSVVILGVLARASTGSAHAVAAGIEQVQTEVFDDAEVAEPVKVAEMPATWTPQPLPKPLHLSHGTIAASAMASVDTAARLRRAAALADIARRADELAPEASPIPLRPVAVASDHAAGPYAPEPSVQSPAGPRPSRFASMGLVDADAEGSIDLDAALRRRRTAS